MNTEQLYRYYLNKVDEVISDYGLEISNEFIEFTARAETIDHIIQFHNYQDLLAHLFKAEEYVIDLLIQKDVIPYQLINWYLTSNDEKALFSEILSVSLIPPHSSE